MPVLQKLPEISASYPDGLIGDALERHIEQSLPKIHELEQATNQSERLAVLNALVARQQAAFIANHGDLFGCETMEASNLVQTNPTRSKALNAT